MKAPTDKRNDTIQIIVTRSCDILTCSNCTQLLPYRTDTMHMNPIVFREALRSVAEWPGIVAMFGGNPCSHPQFELLCQIMREEIPEQRHRGLWTNNLLKHGKVVRETFYPHARFNLNAHGSQQAADNINAWLPGKLIPGSNEVHAWHSAMLMDWQDMGMTEQEWIQKREGCDINLNWSAAIAERNGEPHAYFCEVGASLDGIRGENHGIFAFPGWWKKKMPAFEAQVRGCCDRGCAVPLKQIGHRDNAEVYDVSISWAERLRRKPIGDVSVLVHDTPMPKVTEATDYMRHRK